MGMLQKVKEDLIAYLTLKVEVGYGFTHFTYHKRLKEDSTYR